MTKVIWLEGTARSALPSDLRAVADDVVQAPRPLCERIPVPSRVTDPLRSAFLSDAVELPLTEPRLPVGSVPLSWLDRPRLAEEAAALAVASRRDARGAGWWSTMCLLAAVAALMSLPGAASSLFAAPGATVLTGSIVTGLLLAALWFRGVRNEHLARWRRHLATLMTAIS